MIRSALFPRVFARSPVSLSALACICVLLAGQAQAGAIYVYERPNGSRLITDREHAGQGYRLIKTYATKPYRDSTSPAKARPPLAVDSKYDRLIEDIARRQGLEPALIKAVVQVESAFDPYAVSTAGAMGLMQLMPHTAARYQLSRDQFDPQRNLTAGVTHLQELLTRFNGNLRYALAGYNAGAGAVEKYRGLPPYAETQEYVKRVMTLYALYRKQY